MQEGGKMKEWFIDIEETQKYVDEKYTENRYLIEPRGYNKDTFMEEIWIFVNEIIDKRLDESVEMSMSEINKISHLFRVGHYLICVYTSATDEELYKQLENIYFSTRFSAKGPGLLIEKDFFEFIKKIDKCSPKFTKKSQELAEKLRDIAIDLYNYRSLQSVYSNRELRSQVENMYKDVVDLRSSIKESCKDIQ